MSTSISQRFFSLESAEVYISFYHYDDVFMSLYTIVDGIFISRFIGSNALSSLNIVYPVARHRHCHWHHRATGGNAVISRYLGEEKIQPSKKNVSPFYSDWLSVKSADVHPVPAFSGFHQPGTRCQRSAVSRLPHLPQHPSWALLRPCMLQTLFQSYLVTAGAPHLGLFLTMIAGIINAGLDYVLIVSCDLGIAGAALATGLGQMVPALAGLVFF